MIGLVVALFNAGRRTPPPKKSQTDPRSTAVV